MAIEKAVIYPILVEPISLDPEGVSVDKFRGYQPDKVFDVRRQQYTYPFQPLGLEEEPASEVSVDSWVPAIQQPRQDVRRWQSLYPLAVTDLQPPSCFVISGQDVNITYSKTFQYKSLVAPLTTEAVVEDVTVDKWLGSKPDKLFDVKRLQYGYPYLTLDAYSLTQPERSTPDKWLGSRPDKLFDIKRQQYTYQFQPLGLEEEPASEVSVDSWHPEANKPKWGIKRNQFLYPERQTIDPYLLTQPEQTTVDRWGGTKPDKLFDLRRQQYIYPNNFVDANFSAVPGAETITVDKWFKDTERPRWDIKRTQYPDPVSVADVQLPSLFTISGQDVNITYSKTFQYKSLVAPLVTEVVVEDVTVDKWFKEAEKPVQDLKRAQYEYLSIALDAYQLTQSETITPDKWLGYHPDKVFDLKRAQYSYPVVPLGLEEEPASEVSVDAWYVETNKPRQDVARRQYTYPVIPLGLEEEPATEVSVDSWHPESNKPRFDARRQQYTYQWFAIDNKQLTTPERITIDKWVEGTNEPVRVKPYRVHLMSNYHFDPYPRPNVVVGSALRTLALLGVGI